MLSRKPQLSTWRDRTTVYTQAVQALHRLYEHEGHDAVERASAEVIRHGRVELFGKDAKPLRGAPCLVRLDHDGRHPHKRDELCLSMPGADHTEMLRTPRGIVYVSEPYDLALDTLQGIVETCRKHGFHARIDPFYSTHFPGRTLAVVVSRPRDGKEAS